MTPAERELRTLLGDGGVLPGTTREYLHDATQSRNVSGRADAVALPADAAQVAAVLGWCYDHDVALVPRGGGTGLTGSGPRRRRGAESRAIARACDTGARAVARARRSC